MLRGPFARSSLAIRKCLNQGEDGNDCIQLAVRRPLVLDLKAPPALVEAGLSRLQHCLCNDPPSPQLTPGAGCGIMSQRSVK